MCQYKKAIGYSEQALAIKREIGDREGEGSSLRQMAGVYRIWGQIETAIDYNKQSLAIAREIDDLQGEGSSLNSIGNAYHYWSQYEKKFYFTSDGAWKDKNDNFRVLGRIDDVMKVAGHRLATAELEDAINRHELVTECAVIGAPHEIKGEAPFAFVILIKGAKPSEKLKKELVREVEKAIGPIARPHKIMFVQDLPKTRSGKIMRRILKNLLKNQPLGDITTLSNPESVKTLKKIVGYKGHR